MIKTRPARIAAISLAFKYRCAFDCIHTVTVHRLVFKYLRALHGVNIPAINELRQTFLTVP